MHISILDEVLFIVRISVEFKFMQVQLYCTCHIDYRVHFLQKRKNRLKILHEEKRQCYSLWAIVLQYKNGLEIDAEVK